MVHVEFSPTLLFSRPKAELFRREKKQGLAQGAEAALALPMGTVLRSAGAAGAAVRCTRHGSLHPLPWDVLGQEQSARLRAKLSCVEAAKCPRGRKQGEDGLPVHAQHHPAAAHTRRAFSLAGGLLRTASATTSARPRPAQRRAQEQRNHWFQFTNYMFTVINQQ